MASRVHGAGEMSVKALTAIANACGDGKFALPEDGFVQMMPLGEFPGTVDFGPEKPGDVEGVVQDAEGRWVLPIIQVIDTESVRACASSHRPDTLIDYEHNANRPDGDTRAAGWTEIAGARADGIWVKPRWSADGLADVTGGNYRFLSPVFPWSEMEHLDGNRYRPLGFSGAALTNTPNLLPIKAVSNSARNSKTLSPRVGNAGTAPDLAEREQEKIQMNEKLIQALGLPPEATEDDVLSAVGDIQKRLSELENARAEAQVEDDLRTLGDRVENRDALKKALLKDREAALSVVNALKMPKAVVLNARAVKTPAAAAASNASFAREQERTVENYRIENKCSRKEAWNAVRRERPELFKQRED